MTKWATKHDLRTVKVGRYSALPVRSLASGNNTRLG